MIYRYILWILLFNLSIVDSTYTKAALVHQTITIFSPGYVGYLEHPISMQQANRYAKNNMLHGSYTACTYNDHKKHVNFGQNGDVKILYEHYSNYCNDDENTKSILIGPSRGASVLFTFIDTKKPENIVAVIAESPFASVDDVVFDIIKQWRVSWIPGIKYITYALMKVLYPSYNPNGLQPITSINVHTPSLPILIACSEQDTIIPYTSSVRLAHALKEKGYENVYLLVLSEGAHGFLSYNEKFQQVVNAFYARYNLQHNKELAQQGQIKLERCKL